MFRRHPSYVVVCVTLLALASTLAACKDRPRPAARGPLATPPDAAPPDATAAIAFELVPPPGFTATATRPPIVGVWSGVESARGVVPTLRVTRRPLPYGTPEQRFVTWRDQLLAAQKRIHLDVKVLEERDLVAGPRTGKLVVLVHGEASTPRFSFAAALQSDDALWELVALTDSETDAESGAVRAVGQAEILSALASFRVR